jgi:hypothetical protein
MKWPSEEYQRHMGPEDEEVIDGIQHYIKHFQPLREELFADCVRTIVEFQERGAEPVGRLTESLEKDLSRISDGRESNICNFSEFTLLALVLATAVQHAPSFEVWKLVAEICASHERVGFILPLVIVAKAQIEDDYRVSIVSLIKSVLAQTAGEGPLGDQKRREAYQTARSVWAEYKSVQVVWVGHFWESKDHYWHLWNRVEFEVLSYLDINAYCQMLQLFDEPNAVLAALMAGRVDRLFSVWKTVLAKTRSSFAIDGVWNGDLAVLLALDIALRRQIDGLHSVRCLTQPAEVERRIAETDKLSQKIIDLLAKRSDFPWLIAQWGALFIKRAIAQDEPSNQSIPSPIYVYETLIRSIGPYTAQMKNDVSSHSDPEAWVGWCYRALRTWLATEGHGNFPNIEECIHDWDITIDNWSEDSGQLLKSQASIFYARQDRRNLLGSQLLALPFINSTSPYDSWVKLWEKTFVLREVVEFGDADAREAGAREQSAAESIIIVAFDLGLSMLDSISGLEEPSNSSSTLNLLFSELATACDEMRSIQTFNTKYWRRVRIELALRRVCWAAPISRAKNMLRSNTTPTIQQYLKAFQVDPMELIELLRLLQVNRLSFEFIQEQLRLADINVGFELERVIKLNEVQPAKYSVSSGAIESVRQLIIDQ